MRREGLPVEGFCVAAGIPSTEKAAEIIDGLRSAGIKHVSFKPGSVEGIRQVVNIAAANPDFPIILQWTGGRAGGHHSYEDFHMPTKSMVSAFLRGAALICQNQQKTIDIIIPILLDKRSVLKESSMSALLIQVNGRRQWSSSTANIIDEKEHEFFPNKVSMRRREDTRPYVTLVAELGVDNPPQENSFVVTGNNDERSSKEHLRYGIRAYTCTMAAWKVVGFTEHATYQRIFGTDDFLADHPRQDEASLDLVHQMMSFWYDDAMWYNDEDEDSMDSLLGQPSEGAAVL
ncbi:hypothetical protein F5141DRAFT_1220066 [Pisolithus sp. B1]|nr:hypothetical protein F5141DRAFT_1220066 [Pisolithus sp. B1]